MNGWICGKRAYYAFENTCNHRELKCVVPSSNTFSTHLCFNLMQGMGKWFGRLVGTHLLHDESIDSFVNEAFFCNTNVSLHGKNVGAHASCIILHMVHLTTKSCYSPNGEIVKINTCQSPSLCLPYEPLLQYELAHTHYDKR